MEPIVIGGIIGFIIGAIKIYIETRREREATRELREAEKYAFLEKPQEIETKLRQLAESQVRTRGKSNSIKPIP